MLAEAVLQLTEPMSPAVGVRNPQFKNLATAVDQQQTSCECQFLQQSVAKASTCFWITRFGAQSVQLFADPEYGVSRALLPA